MRRPFNPEWHERGHRVAVRLGAALIPIVLLGAWADSHAADARAWWLNVGGVSAHVGRSDLNGLNPGLGVEYRWSGTWSAGAGVYRNSYRTTTRYAGVIWTPLRLPMPAPLPAAHIGAQAGVVDGYPYRDGKPFLAGALVADWRGERVAVLLSYVPAVEQPKTTHTLALQIRVSF